MTAARASAVKVFGTRYRCRLRYLHIESLDALSEFVLKVASESLQYQRIEVLIQSFGLPPRIMEDVLADLIRTRRAGLDVARGRIIPLGSGACSAEYEDRRVTDVWQDHVTGAILPATVVAPYTTRIELAEPLGRSTADEEFIGFLDASDASLLSSLVRIDPTLEYSFDGAWQLDRFVNRVRLNAQALWIPLTWTTIRDVESAFVEAPEIPWWLTRAWTSQLRREKQIPVMERGIGIAAGADVQGSIANAFQHARIRFHAGRWLDSAQEHLDLNPAPESLQDVRTLDQRIGALQARLLSLVSLSVRMNAELPEEFANATDSIVLTVPEVASAESWILQGAAPNRTEMTLIHGSNFTDAAAKLSPRQVQIPGWLDEFALIDGSRLVLPMAGSAGTRHVVEVSGPDIGRAVEGLLRRLLGFEGAGSLPALQHSSTTRDSLREVRFSDGGLSVGEVLGELTEFRREFVRAMQDRRLRKPAESIGEPEGTLDGLVRAVDEAPKISLAESHPMLADRLNVLRRPLSHSLDSNHSAFTFVEQRELLELLELIVVEPPGMSNLCRIVSRLSETSLEDEVVGVLTRGVAAGWRFCLYPPGTATQIAYAQRLRDLLPSGHIRFFAAPAEWQACLVMLNDVVVTGTFHILADRSASRLLRTWAIVLCEVEVGGELLREIQTWKEFAKPKLSPHETG